MCAWGPRVDASPLTAYEEGANILPGYGFDSMLGSVRGHSVIGTPTQLTLPNGKPGVRKFFKVDIIESWSELLRSSTSDRGRRRTAVFSMDASLKLARASRFTRSSVMVCIHEVVDHSEYVLEDPALAQNALNLLRQVADPFEFQLVYGDRFISSVTFGGEYSG
jgi:hypothetical protein